MLAFERYWSDDLNDVVDESDVRMFLKTANTPDLSIKFQSLVVFQIFKSAPRKFFYFRRTNPSFLATSSVVFDDRNKFECLDNPAASVDKSLCNIYVIAIDGIGIRNNLLWALKAILRAYSFTYQDSEAT